MAITKRDRTRKKLLDAAQGQLLEGGVAALTIAVLTSRAEFGVGTFYNYFTTREDVIEAVTDMLIAAFNRDLDLLVKDLSDPEEILTASCLQTLAFVTAGSDSGRILFDSDLPIEVFIYNVRQRFVADAQEGIRQGVFLVDNPAVLLSMISGAVYGVLSDRYRGSLSNTSAKAVCRNVLKLLGVDEVRAQQLLAKRYRLRPEWKFPLSSIEYLPPLD